MGARKKRVSRTKARAGAPSVALALRHRIPNPPAGFTGRVRELAAARAALAGGPLAFLHGDGGAGKSALARQIVKTRFAKRVATSVHVSEPGSDPSVACARALAAAENVGTVDWAGLLAEPDALVATVIDLAERRARVILLEDVHTADAAKTSRLVSAVARYARASRWIVTSRKPLGLAEIAGAEIAVGPLPDADLARLARRIAGGRDPAGTKEAVRSASGYPGRLVESVLGRSAPRAPDPHDPSGWIDDLRAFVREDGAAADALLREKFATLASAGFAPELWDILRDAPDERLGSWRIAAALELGNADTLASLHEPTAPGTRLLWARVLLARGRAADASAVAADAVAESSGAPRFDAVLLRARALANLGRPADVRALLEPEKPLEPAARALRDIRLAQALMELGEATEATRLSRALAARTGELPAAEAREVRYGAARVLYFAGDLEGAAALVDAIRPGEARAVVANERQILFFRAALALAAGRLGDCRELLERLQRYVAPDSLQARFLAATDLQRRLYAGELDGLGPLLEERIAEASAAMNAHHYHPLVGLRVRLASLQHEPLSAAAPKGLETPLAPFDGLLLLYRLDHAARRGGPVEKPDPRAFAHAAELEILAGITASTVALVQGDAVSAVELAAEAGARAATRGYGLRQAEALLAEAEAHVASGSADRARRALGTLDALARRFPSARFGVESALLRALLVAAPAPATLASVAAQRHLAPAGARRALAILDGDDGALDALDRRVVARAPRGFRRVVDGSGAGWGIDLSTKEVWHANGTLALGTRVLPWKLLEVLVGSGGAADKETLVQRVWGESEYHPLRHDNRLQATVRQLRRLVEEDPDRPSRVVTTAEGYALGAGPVRVRE